MSGKAIDEVFGVPLYYNDKWEVGIGGGLWSTGRALSTYFSTSHAKNCLQQLAAAADVGNAAGEAEQDRGLSIIELGSGNGFLAACLVRTGHYDDVEPLCSHQEMHDVVVSVGKAACATAHGIPIAQLVITDFVDHLELIQKTVDANPEAFRSVKETVVVEHVWGSSEPLRPPPSRTDMERIDLIIGSDVAYGKHVYDPLIQSLTRFSGPNTLALIGFTMIDTRPEFFARLSDAGFRYRRLSDQLLSTEYRGTTFGVFIIQRQQQQQPMRATDNKLILADR